MNRLDNTLSMQIMGTPGRKPAKGSAPVADPSASRAFYCAVMRSLQRNDVPFLVGGAYAMTAYTGITRDTKDLDIFVSPHDRERALAVLSEAGCRTELTFPHWLGKAYGARDCVDIIFGSGNGIAIVDDAWFEHARRASVLGSVRSLVPPEEMIWSKAFVMERERFDGADITHLISSQGPRLDWPRLVDRFGEHWRVLLSHVILFGFIYPDERRKVPVWIMDTLLDRLKEDARPGQPRTPGLCQGTLLSREQYLPDVGTGAYADARLAPYGTLSAEELAIWTADIDHAPPHVVHLQAIVDPARNDARGGRR